MFRQFQKVVFVDNKDLPRNPYVNYPEINEIVTIADATMKNDAEDGSGVGKLANGIFYFLKEYPKSKVSIFNGIHESCFREIDDLWVDELLERIENECNSGLLVL